jgi:RNA-binding protein YhbY
LRNKYEKNNNLSDRIESLELALKNHKQVRISTLKASGRNRENIKLMAEDIISKLKEKCEYAVIGFTIIITKRHIISKIYKPSK